MKKYIGHPSQLFGVEEHRLVGGKGNGMRLIEVNNGKGLMFTVSADRCGDISRMYYKGVNLGYFAPCGYVSPAYYDKDTPKGFLSSFTAGFMTTCGFINVGQACECDGEMLPMHGNISNIPAEAVSYSSDDNIRISLTMRDATLFGRKLILKREYECKTDCNEIIIHDTIKNIDIKETPLMLLYHINLGYPLVCENAKINLNYKNVFTSNERAKAAIPAALTIEKPQSDFLEQCFFYEMEEGKAEIYNPDLDIRLSINYDLEELPCLTEWKMMGETEYVIGIEPGNCYPHGQKKTRDNGILKYIQPGEEIHKTLKIKIEDN